MILEGAWKDSMKSYAEKYIGSAGAASVDVWSYKYGCLLLGFRKMYEATGDVVYKAVIVKLMSPCVEADGSLSVELENEDELGCAVAGNLLYFMYQQTGEEKYRGAIEAIMERVNAQPRLAGGNFCTNRQEVSKLALKGLYLVHPFYLEYENCFNGQKNYYDISGQFKFVRKQMYMADAGLYAAAYEEGAAVEAAFDGESVGLHMMALVDCHDLTSEELYDCRRMVGDYYREAIGGMMEWQRGNEDAKVTLMLAYSILKACRLELLLADKYQKTGEGYLKAAAAALEAAGTKPEPLTCGMLMLAYGEYLLLHAGEI